MSRREDTSMTPEMARELSAIDATLRGEAVDPEWAETAELALLLQVERPQPRPEFAAKLDARAARGFAAKPARARRGWRPGLRPALAFAACLLAAVVVVAAVLTRPQRETTAASVAKAPVPAQGSGATPSLRPARTPDEGTFIARPRAAGSASPGPIPHIESVPYAAVGTTRQVERTSSVTLGVPPQKLQDASRQVFDITTRILHGYVLSSSVASGDGAAGGATFQIKVPSASVSEAEGRLAQLGHVRSQTDTTQDISSAFVSADRRLADANAERRGLLRALGRATTPNQTASVRARLGLVEGQIASAERDIRSLRRRADLTSVSLTIVPEAHGEVVGGRGGLTPGDALHTAGRILSTALSVLLIALAFELPFVLVAGLAIAGTRALRRRRREAALGASPR
jgi:hypothetical protein